MGDCNLPTHNSFYLGQPCLSNKLELSENGLLFELTPDGDRTQPQAVSVLNTGSRVYIRKIEIAGGEIDFSLVDPNEYPEFLETNESFNVVVDFSARIDGIATGALLIYTNEDRLPYVVALQSKTHRSVPFLDLYQILLARLIQEETARYQNDNLIKNSLRNEFIARDQAEAMLRYVTDQDLYAKIASILLGSPWGVDPNDPNNPGGGGTIVVIDHGARAMIQEEYIVRANADMAEAILRLTMQASFDTAISEANARITEESHVYSDRYQAIAERTLNIESTYQTEGQVRAISNAAILVEQFTRASADSAEALLREQAVASLRTETQGLYGTEVINREAAIKVERDARISLTAAMTTSIEDMSSRFTNAHGLTPNANFQAGSLGWNTNFDIIKDNRGFYTVTSAFGAYRNVFSSSRIKIDLSRTYQINSVYTVFVNPCYVYTGISCYDKDGLFLGNVYDPSTSGVLSMGKKVVKSFISGTETYPVPVFTGGHKFPENTDSIVILFLGNYNNDASYVKLESLWLDDITNAYDADARITQVDQTHTTAEGALTSRIGIQESNYTTTVASLNQLYGYNTNRVADLVTANARITNESNTRASAIVAEASRVDTIIANLNITSPGSITAQINAAVLAETNARVTADSAEATRVDSLLAGYETKTGVDGKINVAVSAEVTNRNSAIASQIQAEASRVDNIFVSYSNTTTMNNAITGAVNSEASTRASQDGVLSGRIDTVTATAGTASANASTALSAAVDAQGKLTARVILTADAGNGRAQLSLYSDQYGGAADLIGNLRIHGNLTVDGTMGVSKLAPGSAGQSSLYINENAVTFNSQTVWTTVANIPLTSIYGQPIEGQFSAILTDITGESGDVSVRIRRDDGTIIKFGNNGINVAARDEGESLSFGFADSVPANRATTWYVEMKKTNGADTVRVSGIFMKVTETTKVSYQSVTINTQAGTGPGVGSGGGGTGGGFGCPEINEKILLANSTLDGPGEIINVGEIKYNDWVWTVPENSTKFGAYQIKYVSISPSELWKRDNLPITSPSHLWYIDGKFERADTKGNSSGFGQVVAMTVEKASTYILIDRFGNWRLSHNKLPTSV